MGDEEQAVAWERRPEPRVVDGGHHVLPVPVAATRRLRVALLARERELLEQTLLERSSSISTGLEKRRGRLLGTAVVRELSGS